MIAQGVGINHGIQAVRPSAFTANGFFGILFSLLVLSSTFDKFGVTVRTFSGSTSVSVYKLLFVTLILFYVVSLRRSNKDKALVDVGLYRLIVAFVVIQTIASLLGSLVTPGDVPVSSEIYYLIQRSNVLFIPLFALRCNISPKSLLRLFVGAILIHYAFIGFQILFPSAYISFVQFLYSPIRSDNTLVWSGETGVFYGLQRTANYGVFVAVFGLLIWGLTPRSLMGRALAWTVVLLSILLSVLGYSRATFLMVLFALLVLFWHLRRYLTYLHASVGVMLLAGMFLLFLFTSTGMVNLQIEKLPSIDAFFSPEKEGANLGKWAIVGYGSELFIQSPIVGWGQKRFLTYSYWVGNYSQSTSETHSFILTTILSSGSIGLIAYLVLFAGIVKALWQKNGKDCVIVCSIFVGLGLYNIVYDAGGLDVFGCFNGIASYYALLSKKDARLNVPKELDGSKYFESMS
jgi:hypothetical protein